MSQDKPNQRVVIVTGLSGAGNSTALAAAADAGMYCIDNLPVEALSQTLDLFESGRIKAEFGLALCMDVRDRTFATRFPGLVKDLASRVRMEVIFLTADNHTIATRFSTTRRRHPLMEKGETLVEAIERERELLGPVEESADIVFDTSHWSPQQLARAVETRLKDDVPLRTLHVTVTSFGFKHGQLDPADMLFDVRFIDNPYFEPALRDKSGLDPAVGRYVLGRENSRQMLDKMLDFLRFLIPQYYREGKHYLRIGIGCTGGRHRSVFFAEEIGRSFLAAPIPNTVMTILHRDLGE